MNTKNAHKRKHLEVTIPVASSFSFRPKESEEEDKSDTRTSKLPFKTFKYDPVQLIEVDDPEKIDKELEQHGLPHRFLLLTKDGNMKTTNPWLDLGEFYVHVYRVKTLRYYVQPNYCRIPFMHGGMIIGNSFIYIVKAIKYPLIFDRMFGLVIDQPHVDTALLDVGTFYLKPRDAKCKLNGFYFQVAEGPQLECAGNLATLLLPQGGFAYTRQLIYKIAPNNAVVMIDTLTGSVNKGIKYIADVMPNFTSVKEKLERSEYVLPRPLDFGSHGWQTKTINHYWNRCI